MRARRIDSLAIDYLLYSLRFLALQYHVAIPSFGIDGTPGTKVEYSNVPIDLERQHRFAN